MNRQGGRLARKRRRRPLGIDRRAVTYVNVTESADARDRHERRALVLVASVAAQRDLHPRQLEGLDFELVTMLVGFTRPSRCGRSSSDDCDACESVSCVGRDALAVLRSLVAKELGWLEAVDQS